MTLEVAPTMPTVSPFGVHWVEKYRPTKLEDVALEDETRNVLDRYLDEGEIPHLLLHGPPGSGKTTVARILFNNIDCQRLVLNASNERGIDTVREKIGNFIQAQFGAMYNVVFLDEADAMTSDAQTALRNMIEAHAARSRFVLSCNYLFRIIAPLQSRCQLLNFGAPPLKERYRILASVLEKERIATTPQIILQYAERYPDMRKMLSATQRAYFGSPTKTIPPIRAEDGSGTGGDILTMVEQKNWTALRRMCASGSFDPQQGLRDLFWAVADDHGKVGFLRHVVGKAVHESGFTPDPIILFLGTCAELMEGMP